MTEPIKTDSGAVNVRVPPATKAAWAAAAAKDGRTLSNWIRWHLDRIATAARPAGQE